MSKSHVAVIDWDGTLVEQAWPAMGDWMPGAVEAMRRLHEAGIRIIVTSARHYPAHPDTGTERDPAEWMASVQAVRDMLDEAGLTFVEIHTGPKPGADVYVDDKAERYNGRPGSWKVLTDKILMRLTGADPFYHESLYREAA